MRKSVERHRRGKSRLRTYLYALSGLIVVSALIYWEQTALLYVVSTLVVCALLLAVAFTDLEGKDRELAGAREGRSPQPKTGQKIVATELPLNERDAEVVRR